MKHGALKFFAFLLVISSGLFFSCTENVDISNRYVYSDKTIIDYLSSHENYSEYTRLLSKVPVSRFSRTTLQQLLSARGHYTVFAPTNQAIREYLDTLVTDSVISYPSWEAFTDSFKLDSIRRVIVLNSIIDHGDDEEAYQTWDLPTLTGREIVRVNMNNRKLTVYYTKNPDDILINGLYPVNHVNRDIQLLNGIIHQMESVVAPHTITAADYLWKIIEKKREGYLVMARAIEACGLMDTLRAWRDETYETLYQTEVIHDLENINGLGFADGGNAYAPPHRLIGFTIFAEPDRFWRAQGFDPSDADLLPKLQRWIQEQQLVSPDEGYAVDDNYRDENNLLNLWVTYHMLPMRIPSDKLVIHHNESRYSYVKPTVLGMASEEFYTSMGRRRLIKIYESKESGGVFLNHFPVLDFERRGNGAEVSCDEDKVGCRVGRDAGDAILSDIINCCRP